jgi:hypothetical protein
MNTKEIVIKLLFGETITIKDDEQAKEVQIMLRLVKSNCNLVLSQLNEGLKKQSFKTTKK